MSGRVAYWKKASYRDLYRAGKRIRLVGSIYQRQSHPRSTRHAVCIVISAWTARLPGTSVSFENLEDYDHQVRTNAGSHHGEPPTSPSTSLPEKCCHAHEAPTADRKRRIHAIRADDVPRTWKNRKRRRRLKCIRRRRQPDRMKSAAKFCSALQPISTAHRELQSPQCNDRGALTVVRDRGGDRQNFGGGAETILERRW